MKRIKLFEEIKSEKYDTYIDDGSDSCPVCGEFSNLRIIEGELDRHGYSEEKHCLNCGFKWENLYGVDIYFSESVSDKGKPIESGEEIDKDSFY